MKYATRYRDFFSEKLHWRWLLILAGIVLTIVWHWRSFQSGWIVSVLSSCLAVVDLEMLGTIGRSELAEYAFASIFITGLFLIVVLYPVWRPDWDRHSPGISALKSFVQNRFALGFSVVLFLMTVCAALAPWIAPFRPDEQQDIVVTKYIRPGGSVLSLRLRDERPVFPQRPNLLFSSRVANRLIRERAELQPSARFIYVDGYEIRGEEVIVAQGIQKKRLPLENLIGTDAVLFAGKRTYWLGSDKLGRDLLSRLIYGARISLAIGFTAMIVAVALGTLIGALAGYFGKMTDGVLMRFVDLAMAFPNLFLILMIVGLFGNSILLLIAILGFTGWMGVARIVRGQVLSLKETEYVQAARVLGFGHRRIVARHILPNALGPIIVAATLRIGTMILLEAGLSFLGVGVQPPTASWGTMISDGRDALLHAWWISTFPGLMIVPTVLSVNVAGDGLRDALDPKMKI